MGADHCVPAKKHHACVTGGQKHRIYSRPGLSDSVAKQVEGENQGFAAVRRSWLCVAGIAGVIVAKYQLEDVRSSKT